MRGRRERSGDPNCRTCGGRGACLTCAGTGTWYASSIDEDSCSSCGGSGRCPDCFTPRRERLEPASTPKDAREPEEQPPGTPDRRDRVDPAEERPKLDRPWLRSLPSNFAFLIPERVAGMAFPDHPEALDELLELGFRTAVALTEAPLWPSPGELRVHHHPLPDFCLIDVEAQHAAVQAIQEGEPKVIVFCFGGFGRTGVVLASYLVSLGRTAAEAIDEVRAARPRSIDHPALEQSVHDYAGYLQRLRVDERRS